MKKGQYLPLVTLYFMLCINFDLVSYIWFISCNEFQSKSYLPKYLEHFAEKILKHHVFSLFSKTNKACVSCIHRTFKRSTKVNDTLKSNQSTIAQKNVTKIFSSDSTIQPIEEPLINTKTSNVRALMSNDYNKLHMVTPKTVYKDNSKTEYITKSSDSLLPQHSSPTNKTVITEKNPNHSRPSSKDEVNKRRFSPMSVQQHSDELKNAPQLELLVKESPKPEPKAQLQQKCNFCDMCEKCLKSKSTEQEAKNKKKRLDENIRALNYFAAFLICLTMIACDLLIWLMISYPPSE